MNDEKFSIREIARLANTSVATVSRVINGNGRFSKETERRVRDVIDRYDYRPNLLAKSLREDRVKAIGVIVSDVTSDYFGGIVQQIERDLFRRGYTAILFDTFENEEAEKRALGILGRLRFSGIIYVGGKRTKTMMEDLPIIYVDRKPPPEAMERGSCFIGSDNFSGGRLAGDRLLDAGRRAPAIVLYEDDLETQKQRLLGFQSALAAHGLAFDPRSVFHVDHVTYDGGRQVTRQILRSGIRFDSIFYTSDIIAIGGVQYLNEVHVAVPGDIALLGMDDIPASEHITPALTTVRQQYRRFGALAADSIIRMLDGEPVEDQVLDVQLIERATV
ncbi:MAG: LacI family DNA-binding transcriptional regulator [Clostridia bacterium]|nr:LacI family DNA-binding transcriptional regulator [Clostridia bacterium]